MILFSQDISSRGGVADWSRSRERLRVTGADRVDFLHGQCTNDIRRLTAGQSCYATFLNAKGKMRGEATVVCLADAFLLDASAGLRATLEKFVITEDVVIEDVSATWGAWLVVGNTAEVPAGSVTFPHPLGTGVLSAVPLAVTLNAETLEVLRVEAGLPQWGADLDENTIPVEAGLAAAAISYDKGCYIGQETIARIKTYGHVNRQLVQMVAGGERVPMRGEEILAGGRSVGKITSAVRSIRLGKPLALGYVRREFAVVGTALTTSEQPVEVIKVCGS